MAGRECCVETVRSGSDYFLIQRKPGGITNLLAVLSEVEYTARTGRVKQDGGDALFMFDVEKPEQYASLSQGELDAYKAYICAGLLDELVELVPVTAYEDRRDLVESTEPQLA
jgi:hypothetical protein